MLFAIDNMLYALLLFLMFCSAFKLDELRRKSGVVIYLKRKKNRHPIPFMVMNHEDYLYYLYNRLRITTADFSRESSINVPHEEVAYHRLLENSDYFFVPRGTKLIFEPNQGGSVSITFYPHYSYKD